MPEIPASLAAFATRELRGRGMEIRTDTRIDEVAERRRCALSTGEERAHPHGVLDRGRQAARAVVRELGLPLDADGRIDADADMQVAGPRQRVGDRRRRRRARPGAARQGAVPAHRAARAASGTGGGRQRGGHAGRPAAAEAFATARSGCSWTWASTRRWPPCSACGCAGFPAWFAARTYHLATMPGIAAPAAADGRLDRGPVLRPRVGGPGQLGHLGRPTTLREEQTRPAPREAVVMTADPVHRPDELTFREGRPADLRATFDLSELAVHDTALARRGAPRPTRPGRPGVEEDWERQRELTRVHGRPARQPLLDLRGRRRAGGLRDGCARFGAMEELTRADGAAEPPGPRHRRERCCARCWPGRPHARSSAGWWWPSAPPADLTLYPDFGVMPVTGHWHMRARAPDFLERRSQEIDAAEPAVVVLEMDRAVSEWKRLEPPAIGHQRPQLHEFFGRTRTCLAIMDRGRQRHGTLLDRSARGDRSRGGRTPQDLVPVVLRRSTAWPRPREPESLGGVLRHRQLVAAAAAAQPRLPRLVAELGDVQHARCRASTATCPTRPPQLL